MGLTARQIVKEEFARRLETTGDDEWTRDIILSMEARILHRIEKECIEIPEGSESEETCGAYAEYFPPGCGLDKGHEGNHRG